MAEDDVRMRITLGEGPASRSFRRMRFVKPDGTTIDVDGEIVVDGLTSEEAAGEFTYTIESRWGSRG